MKKCFIICPIGEEGSETRKLSDDFYDLVAEPAIEHEFEVVRADKLSKTSVINDDIVELVQSSDLCIADLSEANANAYYELGRRHECGKPFIQMIRKGHDLKFDVAGIRTIEYSLETPRDVKKSIDAIRAFISNIDFNEMSAGVGGVSIASVAKGIDRLESHMIELKGKLGGSKSLTIPDFDSSEEHIVLKGAQGIKKAILSGNIGLAESLLDGAEDRLGHSQYMECVGMLCLAGSATYKKLFVTIQLKKRKKHLTGFFRNFPYFSSVCTTRLVGILADNMKFTERDGFVE